jgi:hypothetical protein
MLFGRLLVYVSRVGTGSYWWVVSARGRRGRQLQLGVGGGGVWCRSAVTASAFPFAVMHTWGSIVNSSVAVVVTNCVEDRVQNMVSASVVRDVCLCLCLCSCLSKRQHVGSTILNKKPTRCTIVLKSLKLLLYSYSALHVSGTLVPIIRSILILHIQPPVTVCRWVYVQN